MTSMTSSRMAANPIAAGTHLAATHLARSPRALGAREDRSSCACRQAGAVHVVDDVRTTIDQEVSLPPSHRIAYGGSIESGLTRKRKDDGTNKDPRRFEHDEANELG